MTTIKAPFFEIGPKSYLYGDEILELAQAADAASEISDAENEANIAAVRKEVNEMMSEYPLFAW